MGYGWLYHICVSAYEYTRIRGYEDTSWGGGRACACLCLPVPACAYAGLSFILRRWAGLPYLDLPDILRASLSGSGDVWRGV